ncbi:VanZ family protein [Niallia sp. XMNu-256]|uniref:VanZ family protein n=1 Tax=Niallia sp. XMNu-256 TaxID=3082444 RepID=UPI0030CCCE58
MTIILSGVCSAQTLDKLIVGRVMQVELDYSLVFGIDKQMHFFSYSLISVVLGTLVLMVSDRKSMIQNISLLWMGLVAVGVIEEYRQYFLPNRSAELLDAVANLIGVTSGLAIPTLIFSIIVYRHQLITKLLVMYGVLLGSFLVGLLYLDERSFLTLKEPIKEKLRTLVAMIGG